MVPTWHIWYILITGPLPCLFIMEMAMGIQIPDVGCFTLLTLFKVGLLLNSLQIVQWIVYMLPAGNLINMTILF